MWQSAQRGRGGARPHVVIIGGGFGGLTAARALSRAPVRVTLLDRRNHHVFQPLLYQVATAGLNAADIAYPIRSVLRRQENARVLLAEASSIDTKSQTVYFDDGAISYDFVIVATGATDSYFGHEEWAPFAPGLKSVEDAIEIRRRILLAYEAAEREADRDERKKWMTFVIVGAGPTGVELAGALAEIARHTIARDFRKIDPRDSRIVLVEGRDRVLPPYVPSLSASAQKQLEKIGVEVRTGKLVEEISADGVRLGGQWLGARTVLWAAGVAASPLAKTLGAPLDRAGRVLVTPQLSIPGADNVFVIGDLAALKQDGALIPGVAPAAVQEANYAARAIRAKVSGKALRKPFVYRDKGALATIGRAAAVADLGRVRLSGFGAWFVWWAVHIFFLIGFRSRVLVMFGWIWSYITFQRGARLITGPVGRLPRTEEGMGLDEEASLPGKGEAAAGAAAARSHASLPASGAAESARGPEK